MKNAFVIMQKTPLCGRTTRAQEARLKELHQHANHARVAWEGAAVAGFLCSVF